MKEVWDEIWVGTPAPLKFILIAFILLSCLMFFGEIVFSGPCFVYSAPEIIYYRGQDTDVNNVLPMSKRYPEPTPDEVF